MNPLIFEPYCRPQIWGGRQMATRLGKALPAEGRFGESWEISAHPHHRTPVAEGPLQGETLDRLWASHGTELAGASAARWATFPWLLKFLDCQELLSVQVHPDDRNAAKLLGEACGKTEAWVVIEATPTSRIYAGLKPGVDRQELERHLDAGTVDQCLHVLQPKPGDCLFLAAGTVHAVGGGVLLAEIQQSSDATLRLFDWNRVDRDGKPRRLHREEALAAIDWTAGPLVPSVPIPWPGLPDGVRGERLVDCPYFALHRFHLEGSFEAPFAGHLAAWSVLEGEAELETPDTAPRRCFLPGAAVLVPASSPALRWHAPRSAATLLAAVLP